MSVGKQTVNANLNRDTLAQLIKVEKAKCTIDPAHFIREYCKIQHPKLGKLKFNLFDFQEQTLNIFLTHNQIIINKSRQMGISTLIAAYALWIALFNNDKNILILATKLTVARNILIKIQLMYDGLPSWLKKGKASADEKNKLSIAFGNGSRIQTMTTTKESGRSEAASLVIIDEAAFIKNMEETWGGIKATTATGGQVIALSTPNGYGNWFHKTCQGAQNNINAFYYLELPWQLHPHLNQKWRDEQDETLGPRIAAQEYDCSFLTSGQTVISPEILEYYKKNHILKPIEIRGADSGYWVWDYVDHTKQYIVSVDVARGDASDYSTIQVIEAESLVQVAEYQGKINPDELGNLAVAIGSEYNDALLVIENTGIGYAAVQAAINRGYRNLYYSTSHEDKVIDINDYLSYSSKARKTAGFATSVATRPLMVSKLETLMRQDLVKIRSSRLLGELFVFFWYGNKGMAQPGYHDDLVMAFMIGLWTRDSAIMLKNQSMDMTIKQLSLIQNTKTKLNQQTLSQSPHMPTYLGNDISWLL